jgi:hypothetical protein
MRTNIKQTAAIATLAPVCAVWSLAAPAYLWTVRGVLKVTGLDR